MGIPILSVRDDRGNIIPIPAVQGPPGQKGDTGPAGQKGDKGDTGAAGPNLINTETSTPIDGILMGSYGKVVNAIPRINYLSPTELAIDSVNIGMMDGNMVVNAEKIHLNGTSWLYFPGVTAEPSTASGGSVLTSTELIRPPTGYLFEAGTTVPAFTMSNTGIIDNSCILIASGQYFALASNVDPSYTGLYIVPAFFVRLIEA